MYVCMYIVVMDIWHSVKSMYVVDIVRTFLEDEMYSFTSYIVIGAFGLKVLQSINITM